MLFFFKKTSEKSKYLVGILTSLVTNKAIKAFLAKYLSIKSRLKDVTYITKALTFLYNIILINLFLSMISIYLIVNRALAVV